MAFDDLPQCLFSIPLPRKEQGYIFILLLPLRQQVLQLLPLLLRQIHHQALPALVAHNPGSHGQTLRQNASTINIWGAGCTPLLLLSHEVPVNKNVNELWHSGECADEIFGGYPWFHREDMLNSNTFPWSRFVDERTRFLSSEIKNAIKAEEYIARRYGETLEEVPRLPGENPAEARRREIFYLNIAWFMQTLLDRKDRMSMSTGLEVRVPYCDHRLAQYVWNIPWDMKALDGREKGLLRKALEGLLPDDILWRKKSPYPKTHNPAYERSVRQWLLEIVNDGSSPLLQLIDVKAVRTMLETESSDYGRPFFGQLMALPQLFAYLIQVDIWLREYKVSIR